jgi:hypothetical protein
VDSTLSFKIMNVYPENRGAKLKIVFEKPRKNNGI